MIKPRALAKGQTIGIVSPSFWMVESGLETAVKFFENEGYHLKLGKSVFLKEGPFAGSPQERADDIHAQFADTSIDAIICARGGYGANRVLPLLDFDLIRENPKIFLGYSDITTYLTSITQKTGLITFHGPMLSTFKEEALPYNFGSMTDVLSGKTPIQISSSEELKIRVLKEGKAEGPLWGGNMTLLGNRLGTPHQLDTDGTILFLEDVGEYLYGFERMLVHFRDAGMFKNIKGLVFGELAEMKDQDVPFGKTTDEIIIDICGDLEVPIISNFPCGHGRVQATLPISLPVLLDTGKSPLGINLLESPVRKGD